MNKLYCSYYTKSDYITNHMINRLNLSKSHRVLEPSAGDGAFMDELLKRSPELYITAYDINPEAIKILNHKYGSYTNVNIIEKDTLLDPVLDEYVIGNGYFDRVIGNPPYGAWQDYDKRADLKKMYKGYYVKETYTLFLLRCISLLKDEGVLSFIIPDTFLALHMHKKVREFLLRNTKISEILMMPSSFFPNVNFGYSNLAIITLQKCTKGIENNIITIVSGLKRVSDIADITNGQNLDKYKINYISQSEVFNSLDSSFLVNAGERERRLINNSSSTLGDLADCVTGFYSGDNKRYLKVASTVTKNLSKCPVVTDEEIREDFLGCEGLLDGIEGEAHYIPIVKGSSKSYVRADDWYVNWGKDAVNHYKSDKKARFQNSQFYFKKGIALPMVKSKEITASLIENRIFDQSIVGIFPKNEKYLLYLLAALNSDVVNDLVHAINHTANNSANYIKKIPIILPDDDELESVNELVKRMITKSRIGKKAEHIQKELNEYFRELYQS